MAYDASRQRVVLFGGAVESGQFGDTWEWDGTRWTQVATTGPSARAGMQLAYDERRRVIVGFGGYDQAAGRLLGDTWTWNGTTWTEASRSGPTPRTHHTLAHDSARGRVVLFGGNTTAAPPTTDGLVAETWEWDGAAWSRMDRPGPSRRDHHGMAHDAARRQTLVFGGWTGGFVGDTWLWDGVRWQAASGPGPSARGGVPSLTYDSHRERVVLFGGWGDSGALADVWEWDGRQWTRR
jgi:hypothetical protein